MWFARNSEKCGGGIVMYYRKPVRKYTVTDYGEGVGVARHYFDMCWFRSGWACGPLLGDLENDGYLIRLDDYPWGSVTIFGKENIERLKALKWEDEPIEIKLTI